ncbi:MAG TPA: phosphoglucomutase/phosphomannomutase family protein [Pyrinomonadaceae bacterium]|nr:phosphoglucomutase/phosphomannomutase family protein [Pyrinomonadaceae bacterium]
MNQEDAVIKFGTDGWRAVIAREFTFANLERVAQAYADHLLGRGALQNVSLVVVGYDRRFLSEYFAERAAQIIAGNGMRVALFRETQPTPVISWSVKQLGAVGGVMITASHNPFQFNGFKIKAPWGGSAPPETTAEVEKLLDVNHPSPIDSFHDGHELLEPVIEQYRAQVNSYIDIERLRNAGVRVIVDPMHGSAGYWVQSFLEGGKTELETIRANRDPLFGGVNPEPIDQNLGALKQRVLEKGALVGLATDGDADRVGAVNELGETMTMHDVVPLLLLHLARSRRMTGAVVRTFSQSVLLKRIAAACNLKLYETPIGFKYIADLMLKDDILLGAEESGGIGVKGHIPERDGVLNSLLFLEAIVAAGKPPSVMLAELHREFGEFHFGRYDMHLDTAVGMEFVRELTEKPPADVAGYSVIEVQTTDGTKLLFADESWLLFRQSGTEPVLRIYAEATSVDKMKSLLAAGEKLAAAKVSS